MSARQRWISILIVVLAFALRVAVLALRPAHFDEGINGSFIDNMRTTGHYAYDPGNFHGPLHFYTLFASQQLFGRGLWALRVPTVLVGTAFIWLMLAFHRFLPWRAVWVAAVAAAISPAMVFYSRYAIHEMWLPFFTLLAVYGGCGILRREGRFGDLWAFGAGLAGMVLTKETYLVHWIAAALALIAARCLEWIAPLAPRAPRPRPADLFSGRAADDPPPVPRGAYFSNRQIAIVTIGCFGAVLLFQSGFGMAPEGINGLTKTFAFMFAKGTEAEAGHNKEFFYWVKLMSHYEWPALLGLVAAPVLALRRSVPAAIVILAAGLSLIGIGYFQANSGTHVPGTGDFLKPHLAIPGLPLAHIPRLALSMLPSLGVWLVICSVGLFAASPAQGREMRWLGLFGLASFAAYSLIPYKTPWCIINLLWPSFFILGQLAENLAQSVAHWLVYVFGALLAVTPLQDCWSLNYVHPTNDTDRRGGDRYCYVHTTPDINRLLRPVRNLVRENPLGRQMRGNVFTEAFPLSWELNDFPNITWFASDSVVENYDADFILVPADRQVEFEDRAFGIYFRESVKLRNGLDRCWLYLSAERFASQFPGRTPEIRPRAQQRNPALPDPLRK